MGKPRSSVGNRSGKLVNKSVLKRPAKGVIRRDVLHDVPCMQAGRVSKAVRKLYKKHGILLIRGAGVKTPVTSFDTLRCVFKCFPDVVKKTWWVENEIGAKLSPAQIFGKKVCRRHPFYCSFIMQGSKRGLETVLRSLPFAEPEFLHGAGGKAIHEECAWIFFGKNDVTTKVVLRGRTEHTDSVEHAGTWHIQCSGSKTWFVRPLNDKKLWSDAGHVCPRLCTAKHADGHRRLQVNCNQGDLFIINTRLWYHQTQLPVSGIPSLSVARDFRWANDTTTAGRHAAAIAAAQNGAVFSSLKGSIRSAPFCINKQLY